MSKNTTLLLIVWNVLLSAVLAWSLLRTAPAQEGPLALAPTESFGTDAFERDSIATPDARIAYFYMDSVQQRFELVKEQGDRYRAEGLKLENNLKNEMNKAQKRYQQLMAKDHTYSTKAELQADEEELQGLMGKIQEMQSNSEERLARLEVEMLSRISDDIMEFLSEYNKTAGFDYIFSVQSGGQIWVGNPGLDISDAVVNGLNKRHRASKTAKP
jgi:outer membrane protein